MSTPRFLLNTNILINLIGGSSVLLRRRVEDCEPGSIITSTLCVAEAKYEAVRDNQNVGFEALLAIIEPQSFDLNAAAVFASLPFRGGKLDRLIAAHALALDVTLVTNNEVDFQDIPALRVENWTL